VDLKVDTNVLKEHTVSIFNAEVSISFLVHGWSIPHSWPFSQHNINYALSKNLTSALKMEAEYSSETYGSTYKSTQCYYPEDRLIWLSFRCLF
jgi:hypothetical protein